MWKCFKKKEKEIEKGEVFCSTCKHFEKNSGYVVETTRDGIRSSRKGLYLKDKHNPGKVVTGGISLYDDNYICTKNIRFTEFPGSKTPVEAKPGYYKVTFIEFCNKKNENNNCKDFE